MAKIYNLDRYSEGLRVYNTILENDTEIVRMLKTFKVIMFFCSNATTVLFRTKLHELLFYAQYYYFKKHKEKLFDEEFFTDYFGPAMKNLDFYLNTLVKSGVIVLDETKYGTKIVTKIRVTKSSYTKNECEVLEKVLNEYGSYSFTDDTLNKNLLKLIGINKIINFESCCEG